MDTLAVNISWEWALGIFGSLIAIAWYTSGRFSRVETSIEWIKDLLKEVKLASDSATTPVFAAHSPVNLNPLGETFLNDSGLKQYIDSHKDLLLKECKDTGTENPYKVQQHAFKIMDEHSFDNVFYDGLQKFAFEKGTTLGVIRRIGGLYLRGICLDSLGMRRDDIDKHIPPATA